MGKTTTPAYTRRATFKKVNRKDGQKLFKAVNRRAITVCKKLGKRSNFALTEQELKDTMGKGSYTFWYYTATNKLRKITA